MASQEQGNDPGGPSPSFAAFFDGVSASNVSKGVAPPEVEMTKPTKKLSFSTNESFPSEGSQQDLIEDLTRIAWEPTIANQVNVLKSSASAARGWILYDVAHSIYSLAINFFVSRFIRKLADDAGYSGKQFWQYTSAATTVVGVLAFITFCSIGEYGDLKHLLWRRFAIISTICLMLFMIVVVKEMVWVAAFLTVLTRVSKSIASILYHALLAEVAPVEGVRHRLSSVAAAAGYVGSIAWFIIVGLAFLIPNDLAYETDWLAFRLPTFVGGVWWLVFGHLSFIRVAAVTGKTLPDDYSMRSLLGKIKFAFVCGTKEIYNASKIALGRREHRQLRLYILAWIFLSDASQTAVTSAAIIAQDEFDLSNTWLAGVAGFGIITAGIGAISAWRFVKRVVNPNYVLISNVCILAGLLAWVHKMQNKWEIIVVTGIGGFQVGCIAALGRSVLSNLIPKGNYQTPLFALWEFSQKSTSWIGPLVVAILTGHYGDSSYKTVVVAVVAVELAIGIPIYMFAVCCS